MYNIGEYVVYGFHGVCRIVALEDRVIDRKNVQYYALEPVKEPGSRFLVPTQNQTAVAKMKPMLTKAELEAMIAAEDMRQDVWIADENLRKQTYRELINSGDRKSLMKMVGSLRRQKEIQTSLGRKFHQCDENFLRDGEKLLSSEFSMVLGIAPEQVGQYLMEAIDKK